MNDAIYAKLNELVQQFPPQVGPLKMTREQIGRIPKATPNPYGPDTIGLLTGIPYQLVETFEESTPHLEGWTDAAEVAS